MKKKKATKKKPTPKRKPKPMSKGFGHLTIKKDWLVRGDAAVWGGDKNPDSQDCWENAEWE